MQKREKILLAILLVVLSGFGFQRLIGLESESESIQLQVYKIENLQKIIKDSEVNQIPNISIDKKKYSKNFFNRSSNKSLKPVVQPVLDEIIEGPQGYAAIINGNFVISGDIVLGFEVGKIEKNRVILNSNGKRKILKRN